MNRPEFLQSILSIAASSAMPHPATWDDHGLDTILPTNEPLSLTTDLLDAGSERFDLNDYRGRPLLVNIFATWCDDCHDEQARVVTVANRFKEDGLAVIGLDWRDSDNAVRAYRRQYDIKYPIAMDRRGDLVPALTKMKSKDDRMLYFPTSLLIRPNGTLYGIWRDKSDPGELEYRVLKLLSEMR